MAKKIEYLFTPIPKKIVPALMKIRLSAYENNLVWMYCDLQYGNEEKKKFVKVKYDTIKKKTGIDKPHISRTLKKLKNRKILRKTDAGWGINVNIHEWPIPEDEENMVQKLPKKATYPNRQQNIPNKANAIAHAGNKPLPNEDCIKEEDISKKNIDKELLRIKHFWNNLAKKEQIKDIKGLIRIHNFSKSNGKLDRILESVLKDFDFKTLRRSIWNYHQFMSLPTTTRSWKGHQWTLQDSTTKQIEKFEDWNVVRFNYVKEDKLSSRSDKTRPIREGDL